MVFKKGYNPTEDQRRKQSLAKKKAIEEGRFVSPVVRNPNIKRKISEKLEGKKHSKERRKNISKAVKESYRKGRVRNHPKKVTKGKIKYQMRKGIQKPITHWIWFDNYGYFPKEDEIIHHEDFDESNNSLENLKLMKRKLHNKLHWTIKNDNKKRKK